MPSIPGGWCRVILDPPASGAWNMAVDEALLHSAVKTGVPVLRFYGWSAPTLSLGYFQRLEDRRLHPPSAGCDVVRRASGGGAIVHDRELTYSLALPAGHALAASATGLYRAVHGELIEALAAAGGQRAHLCETAPGPGKGDEAAAFLCFHRRAEGDLLLGDSKIAGSAQRRAKGGLIQHGSILLGRSSAAPELAGWEDLTGCVVSADALAKQVSRRLAAAWRLSPVFDAPSDEQRQSAEELAGSKYANSAWTTRR